MLEVNEIQTLVFAVSDSELQAVQFWVLHLPPQRVMILSESFCTSATVNVKACLHYFLEMHFAHSGFAEAP